MTGVKDSNKTSATNKIGKWIATNLLAVPASIYDVAANIHTILLGLVRKVGLSTGSDVGSRDFTAPDFNLEQIQNAYQLDGYVRQAVDKYVDLVFKSGYDIVGKNIKAVDYIKSRFAYMSEVSGVPQEIMFSEIVENIIKFNNVIIAKARTSDKAALPSYNISGLDNNDPVGTYYILPLHTIKAKRDKFGVVLGWQQEVSGQDKPVTFKPQDIIHMYTKREAGVLFAYPTLLSVIDDVRALREVEERVLHMIFRNVHPFVHAKIGSKEIPGQPEEVDGVKFEIENMNVEGGLVTTDRVNIDTINTKNVIDAEKYLRYFEERVFTGLAVSGTMMGRSDTSNRSTSDNQKEEASDRVKSIHRVTSVYITAHIINELLREGGFDPLNKPEDKVEFIFKDPDSDSKIKLENHNILLYQSNSITENEMRLALGRDPIPDSERDQLWFPQYGNKSTNAQASNTTQPENQSGKKLSPGKTKNTFDSQMKLYMCDLYNNLLGKIPELNNPLIKDINSSYASTTIKNIKTLVQYTETLIRKLIVSEYGEEKFTTIISGINQIFSDIYMSTVDSIVNYEDDAIAVETVSVVYDIFIENLNYIIKQLREEDKNNEQERQEQ